VCEGEERRAEENNPSRINEEKGGGELGVKGGGTGREEGKGREGIRGGSLFCYIKDGILLERQQPALTSTSSSLPNRTSRTLIYSQCTPASIPATL